MSRSLAALLGAVLLAACAHTPWRSGTSASLPPVFPVAVALGASRPQVIGTSVEGRPIEVTEYGSGDWRVYLIAGIHGDERPGIENVERLRSFLESAGLPGAQLRMVADANPDGTANGTRKNARGVDLNRNWPASNFSPAQGRGPEPLSEPETAAVYADIERFEPHLIIVLHAARRGPYVNYDGPARPLASRFARAAGEVQQGWHAKSEMGYPTPGSIGSLVGVDRDLPILTVELRRGQDAAQAWPGLRAGLSAVLTGPDPATRQRPPHLAR